MKSTLARFNRSVVGIAFELPSRPGTLWRALEVFKNHSINLTHVDKRPSPLPPHTQTFFVHFEGSLGETKTQSCLRELSTQAISPIYRVSAPYVPYTRYTTDSALVRLVNDLRERLNDGVTINGRN